MASYIAEGIKNVGLGHKHLIENEKDPRVDNWALMDSPWPTFQICVGYMVLVKYIGPALMKHREPFNLQKILKYYNLLQVCVSSWLFYEFCQCGWLGKFNFQCQPVDFSNHPQAIRLLNACWFFYLSKFLEFFDTFFIVLKKNDRQISFLHVIHHGFMPWSLWHVVKVAGGGHATFFAWLNSFVHVVMYSYYFIASVELFNKKTISAFKIYITSLQMLQFGAVFIHTFQLLIFPCDFPKVFIWGIGGHAVVFLLLFYNFFRQNYKKENIPHQKQN